MESFNSFINFFQTGGMFMYPILFVLGLGSAIAIERYIVISKSQLSMRRTWGRLLPLLETHDYNAAMSLMSRSKSKLSIILTYGFNRMSTAQRRDDIEAAMEEGMMEVMPSLEARTHYLATYANIATLLGLLGTIIGLIQAFTAVANADPAEKADLLSASISVAMNTTAFGLIAAIPLLLMHTVIQTKTSKLVDNLEMAAVKCLNIITSKKKPTA
ncbi:MAG: MotA/TolQ/ExbB proton channel family protein [Gammaproteobacteria bacterium]|nr:MotA/TolQ/ExbB proton channel family protein [Gammaproteobacteria bacterium]